MSQSKRRQYSVEFRIQIAKRMLADENVVALSREYGLTRSMMYRWRDTFRQRGPAGLARSPGRPGRSAPAAARPSTAEERLRQRIAELERKIGQQTVEIDFFKGVFKRLEELPKSSQRGGAVSIRRSGK
jgi:transposase-like protein